MPAVDGDVRTQARDALHDADPYAVTAALPTIERPGSTSSARQRQPVACRASLPQRAHRHAGQLGDRRRLVVRRVADAQTTAEVEEPALEAEVAPPRRQRRHHGLDAAAIGGEIEDLRADVGVDADEFERREAASDPADRLTRPDRRRGRSRTCCPADRSARRRACPAARRASRGPAPSDGRCVRARARPPSSSLDLVERVHDEVADAHVAGASSLSATVLLFPWK